MRNWPCLSPSIAAFPSCMVSCTKKCATHSIGATWATSLWCITWRYCLVTWGDLGKPYAYHILVVLLRQVSNEETLKLLQEESMNMQKIDINFCEFRFVPRSMEELKTSAAVVAVFQDLGLKERWSINQETLSRLSIDVAAIFRPALIQLLFTLFF